MTDSWDTCAMSYDLEIWCAAPGDWTFALPDPASWESRQGGATRMARGWQILIDGPLKVETEDVPEDVAAALPGISHLFQLSLEPIGAPKSAYQLLRRTARSVSRACHGVISDMQTDELQLLSGVRRYQAPSIDEGFSLVEMTWFFTDSPLLQPSGIRALLQTLKRELPEALPRRYGEFEPPQYRLEETGLEHFGEFLHDHAGDIVVWYPTRPVADAGIHADDKWGWNPRLGFRVNYMKLGIEDAVLSQTGWSEQLQRVWRALTRLARPFYGDVRTLAGYKRSRNGALWIAPDTEQHPVKAWWWRGIPATIGHAAVLGPPYVDIWPAFKAEAEEIDGMWFVSNDAWIGPDDAAQSMGGVPDSLRAPEESQVMIEGVPAELLGRHREPRYAQGWPFTKPPSA